MSDQSANRVPRILCLDGGGVRGLSSLLILHELMEDIEVRTGAEDTPKPCEYFDLIGGTSTGGLIAIMLGILGMSVKECIDAYGTMSKEVFAVDLVIAGKIPVGDDRCRFDFSTLERKIQELVEQRLGDKNHIMSAKPKPPKTVPQCRTFVVAQMGIDVTAVPSLFRSYAVEGVPRTRCKIWEAARATSAAPSFFKPIKIDDPTPIQYVDGALGWNNPAGLAIVEAQRIWNVNKTDVCLVSIGTGQQSAMSILDESLENDLETQRSLFRQVQSSLSNVASTVIPYWKTAKNIPPGILALLKMAGALTRVATNTEAVHDALEREAHQRFPYFRFNVERNVGDIGLEDWRKMEALASYTKGYMSTSELERKKIMCTKCLLDPSHFNRMANRNQLLGHTGLESISVDKFLVPFERNPLLTGRESFLKELRTKMLDRTPKQHNHRIALYGMGGIGKTQTAIEYVYSNRDCYKRIYWITGVDQASLLSGYLKIAEIAGLKSLLNLTSIDIAKGVLAWLRQEKGWLLIIDNLDDIGVAAGFLPENSSQNHTLITTRDPYSAGIPAEGLEVPLLDLFHAVDLLCTLSNVQILPNSPESFQAAQIVEELGYLPLGIEQAAAYVREVAGDFATYIQHYEGNRTVVHQWIPRGNRPYSHSVATTWLLSFNIVQKSHPLAALLFRILSFMHPDGILLDFLQSVIQAFPPNLQELLSSPMEVSKARIELEKFSLLKWNPRSKTFVIHRLVQAVMKDQMSETERLTICWTVLNMCESALPKEGYPYYTLHRPYFGQLIIPLLNIKSVLVRDERLADLIGRFGDVLRAEGKNSESEKMLKAAMDISTAAECLSRSQIHSVPPSFDSYYNLQLSRFKESLALNYSEKGQVTEAKAMLEELSAERQGRLGMDHPATLNCMANLAWTYVRLGNFREAEKMQQELLRRGTRLGIDYQNRNQLDVMSDLAYTYFRLGKLWDAEMMYEDLVGRVQMNLGMEHPTTLRSMGYLATTYARLGKLEKAKTLLEEVAKKLEMSLGMDHPDTLFHMSQIPWTYGLLGRLREAETMQEEVLKKLQTTFGMEHEWTLNGMNDLALLYCQVGKLREAEAMQEEVLRKQSMSMGRNHPLTLQSANDLAVTYAQLGKLKEAEKIQEETLQKLQVIVGVDHPDTRYTMNSLIETYRKLGKLTEAEKLKDGILAITAKSENSSSQTI